MDIYTFSNWFHMNIHVWYMNISSWNYHRYPVIHDSACQYSQQVSSFVKWCKQSNRLSLVHENLINPLIYNLLVGLWHRFLASHNTVFSSVTSSLPLLPLGMVCSTSILDVGWEFCEHITLYGSSFGTLCLWLLNLWWQGVTLFLLKYKRTLWFYHKQLLKK